MARTHTHTHTHTHTNYMYVVLCYDIVTKTVAGQHKERIELVQLPGLNMGNLKSRQHIIPNDRILTTMLHGD